MRPRSLVLGGFALAVLAGAGIALAGKPAATPCADRDRLLATLASRSGERPAARAVVGEGRLMLEVTVDPADLSWTAVLSDPMGCAWSVLSGQAWQPLAPARPAVGERGS